MLPSIERFWNWNDKQLIASATVYYYCNCAVLSGLLMVFRNTRIHGIGAYKLQVSKSHSRSRGGITIEFNHRTGKPACYYDFF